MIIDALATFLSGTALNTGAAGTYLIGDVMDLSVARNAGFGIGAGQLWLVVKVDTTATSGGSATLIVDFITDDNSAMASPTTLFSTAAIPVASLVAGYLVFAIPMPSSDLYERYIGLQQRTGTAAFTAGKLDAFLTNTPPVYRTYADGLAAGA